VAHNVQWLVHTVCTYCGLLANTCMYSIVLHIMCVYTYNGLVVDVGPSTQQCSDYLTVALVTSYSQRSGMLLLQDRGESGYQ